jgi:site-specific recombinase XerC
VAQRPAGPLVLNNRGQPWSRNAVRCRFRRLRLKLNLGQGVAAYAYRHTFATTGLEEGVSLAAMADLLELGAAARLLAEGELEDVLPLDDAALLKAARPIAAGNVCIG